MKRVKVFVVMVAVGLAMTAAPARAALITGSISFGGDAMPLGGNTWGTATGVDFGNMIIVSSSPNPTGTYTGTEGLAVTFQDFSLGGTPVSPLWTFTSGGTVYSFNLLTVGVSTQGTVPMTDPVVSFLNLFGTGTLTATGATPLDPTPGTFAFSAQGIGTVGSENATFSFSSSDTALRPVPEPASLLLLGTGLVAVARRVRNNRRKNA